MCLSLCRPFFVGNTENYISLFKELVLKTFNYQPFASTAILFNCIVFFRVFHCMTSLVFFRLVSLLQAVCASFVGLHVVLNCNDVMKDR